MRKHEGCQQTSECEKHQGQSEAEGETTFIAVDLQPWQALRHLKRDFCEQAGHHHCSLLEAAGISTVEFVFLNMMQHLQHNEHWNSPSINQNSDWNSLFFFQVLLSGGLILQPLTGERQSLLIGMDVQDLTWNLNNEISIDLKLKYQKILTFHVITTKSRYILTKILFILFHWI